MNTSGSEVLNVIFGDLLNSIDLHAFLSSIAITCFIIISCKTLPDISRHLTHPERVVDALAEAGDEVGRLGLLARPHHCLASARPPPLDLHPVCALPVLEDVVPGHLHHVHVDLTEDKSEV